MTVRRPSAVMRSILVYFQPAGRAKSSLGDSAPFHNAKYDARGGSTATNVASHSGSGMFGANDATATL